MNVYKHTHLHSFQMTDDWLKREIKLPERLYLYAATAQVGGVASGLFQSSLCFMGANTHRHHDES